MKGASRWGIQQGLSVGRLPGKGVKPVAKIRAAPSDGIWLSSSSQHSRAITPAKTMVMRVIGPIAPGEVRA